MGFPGDILIYETKGPGEMMIQWLKAFTALMEDLGEGSSTHMAPHNHL